MSRVVIDTNVLIVANGNDTHVDAACRVAAAKALHDSMSNDVILIDSVHHVIEEYKRYCSFSGQPGIGDLFFKTLFDNIATPERVSRIHIGETSEEISTHIPTSLLSFDKSDWKWLALYFRGKADSIINAADSDYLEHNAELLSEGVTVKELCRNCLKRVESD